MIDVIFEHLRLTEHTAWILCNMELYQSIILILSPGRPLRSQHETVAWHIQYCANVSDYVNFPMEKPK